MSKTSRPAPAIVPSRSACTSAGSFTMGPRLVLTRIAVGFISASSRSPIRSRVRSESCRWIVTTSAVASSSSFSTRRTPTSAARSAGRCCHPAPPPLAAPLVGGGRAPGDDVHLEGAADPGDPLPQPAEAEHPEPGAGEVGADGLLPAAGTDGEVLLRDVPGDGEDQRPGELGGAGGVRAGAADGDAELPRGADVDGDVARAGGDQQPQVRQPLEDVAREGRALAHGDDDVERLQPGDERVLPRWV